MQVGGLLYGTTQAGGIAGYGTAFSIDPKTAVKTILYSFTGGADGSQPAGGLAVFGDAFYGLTSYGGASGSGTVFRLDPASGQLTTLHAFGRGTDGAFPIGTLVRQGPLLYGATSNGGKSGNGTLFHVNPAEATVGTLYSFAGGASGAQPLSSLISDGTALYGTTAGGSSGWGTAFRIQPISRAMTTLYTFTGGADGAYPSGLVLAGGTLYGTTQTDDIQGGSSQGGGVIFSLNPATGQETTLYTAPGGSQGGVAGYDFTSALTARDGVLFGTTTLGGVIGSGTVFSFDTASAAFTSLHSFAGTGRQAVVNAALIRYRGVLVGTTTSGGLSGAGEVYRIVPATGAVTVVHKFGGQGEGHTETDGILPHAGLVYTAGKFFGTTTGPAGGIVYAIDPATSAESIIGGSAEFNAPSDFESELTASGGVLYGTSFYGGVAHAGTVFVENPAKLTATSNYAFGVSSSGTYPKGGLLQVGRMLYGTTSGLVPGNAVSAVYAFDPSESSVNTVHVFSAAEGLHPVGTLIQFGSFLYGTTSTDGPGFNGTVFSVDPATGAQKTVHAFRGTDGGQPLAGLTLLNGSAFGTTSRGGPHGAGTVFHLDLTTGAFTILHAFKGDADGGNPAARLTLVNGTLYGTTTTGGAGNRGTVFSIAR